MLNVAPPVVGDALLDVAPPLAGGDEPATSVTLAARSSIIHWAAGNGLIHNAVDLDAIAPNLWRPQEGATTRDWTDFLSAFDAVISLLGGPNEPVSANLRRDCQTHLHCIDPRPIAASRHIVHQWLDHIEPLDRSFPEAPMGRNGPTPGNAPGPKPENPESREGAGYVAPHSRAELSSRCRSTDRPIVLIHPGSGGQSKCCELEVLEPLIPALEGDGLTPAWIVGPDEMERLGDSHTRRLESTAPLIHEESVVAAADLVTAAHAYIGMDAGMTHVAALAGVTTVALFGPTDPAVWRPLGRRVHVLPFAAESPPSKEWIQKIERCVLPG